MPLLLILIRPTILLITIGKKINNNYDTIHMSSTGVNTVSKTVNVSHTEKIGKPDMQFNCPCYCCHNEHQLSTNV